MFVTSDYPDANNVHQAPPYRCPNKNCGEDLRDDPIPDRVREQYPAGTTHYTRAIRVKVKSNESFHRIIYRCPKCEQQFEWNR